MKMIKKEETEKNLPADPLWERGNHFMFTFSKKFSGGGGACRLEFCLLIYLLFVLP